MFISKRDHYQFLGEINLYFFSNIILIDTLDL